MTINYKQRARGEEIMDDFTQGGPQMDRTLYELDVINRFLGGNSVLKEGLDRLYPQLQEFYTGKTLHIADFGCGSGDSLRLIHRWAQQHDLNVHLTGVDANEHVLRYARQHLQHVPEVELLQEDILAPDFRHHRFDLVTMSLFCHHFDDIQLSNLLGQMREQGVRWVVINDLHRHPLAFHSIKVLTRLFSRSPMVQNDGPLSVLRAFSRQELEEVFSAAGVERYTILWRWAFRYLALLSLSHQ